MNQNQKLNQNQNGKVKSENISESDSKSIIYTVYHLLKVAGKLEPIKADFSQDVGYTTERSE